MYPKSNSTEGESSSHSIIQVKLPKMQRLFPLKLASKSSSLFHCHPHKPFFPTQTLPYHHKFQTFLPNPSLKTCQLLVGPASKRLSDSRQLAFLQQSLNLNPSRTHNQTAWRTWLRGLLPRGMVLGLIVANVGVFLLWKMADPLFMYKNFTLALHYVASGRVHTMITYAFSHLDNMHIITEMIYLHLFGSNIERNFGPKFLLKLYLAGALGGSVFDLAASSKIRPPGTEDASVGLGASSAVNAIMLLDIFLRPTASLCPNFIIPLIPIPAILLGVYLIVNDILGIMIEGDHKVSSYGHLGGATVAAIAWSRLRKGRRVF